MSHDIETSEEGSPARFVAAGIAEALVLPPYACIEPGAGPGTGARRQCPIPADDGIWPERGLHWPSDAALPGRGANPIQPDDVAPLERLLLDLAARARIEAGLPLLSAHAPLMDAARRHTLDMGLRLSLFHSDLHEHYRICCDPRCWVGENVGRVPDGRGLVLGSVDPRVSVKMIHRAWMASPEHRANIVDPGFRLIGVSAVQGADLRFYATQVLAG